MTAPERIWAHLPETYGSVKIGTCADTVRYQPHGTEYILHTRDALATPAPGAVQEAARVPEIAALIEAADNLMLNYLQDELCEPDLCVDDEHWAAIHDFNAALRAIAGSEASHE